MKMSHYKLVDEVLYKVEKIALPRYQGYDIDMLYFDWPRRRELLIKVTKYVHKGSTILDAGAAPGFTSLALRLLGYNVIFLDIEVEPYEELLNYYGIKALKCDLEKDPIALPENSVDAVTFTEVIEHLHPYHVPTALSNINKVMKNGGILFLSTPNAVSIGKRIKALIGKNPCGNTHAREYTLDEITALIQNYGFEIVESMFSLAYDVIPYHAHGPDYLNSPIRALFKYPSKENFFKAVTLPLVYLIPSLRADILVIAKKLSTVRQTYKARRY